MTDHYRARRTGAVPGDRLSRSLVTGHACESVSDEALDLALRLARALSISELRTLVERVEAGGGAMPLAAVVSPEELRALVAVMAARMQPHGGARAGLGVLPARGAA